MSLVSLQRDFQQEVLTRAPRVADDLAGAERGDLPARLGAYVEGYRGRLAEALGVPYGALRKVMGPDAFDDLARAYIERNPSRHYNIRYYGADLWQLVVERNPGEAGAALGELARWEWLLADVFDAPDDEPLPMEALAAVAPTDWPNAAFTLRASLRRVVLATNAVEWWRWANDLASAPAALAPAPEATWLAWRRGTQTFFRSMSPLEAGAVEAVAGGATFGDLCEKLAADVEETEVALRAASFLRTWLSEELIASFAIAGHAG